VVATVKVFVAAGPLLPADDVRSPVELSCPPTVDDVTLTVTVQLAPAATLPVVYVTVPPPSTAVKVPSEQVVAALAGVASVTFAGKLCVKAKSVAGAASAVLFIVYVRVEVPPGPRLLGE
jgi:hypothetical protein